MILVPAVLCVEKHKCKLGSSRLYLSKKSKISNFPNTIVGHVIKNGRKSQQKTNFAKKRL